jgi:chromosome segregation ATPase
MSNKFVTAVLKTLNKDEKTLQKEKVEQFVQDAKIEAELQLSQHETGDLQKARLQLTRDENSVVKAKKVFEETRYSMHKDFTAYFNARQSAKKALYKAEQTVEKRKNEIQTLEATIQEFKDIIQDFS